MLVAFAACESSDRAACDVDTDCAQGQICRENVCGVVSPDASTPVPEGGAPVCVADGVSCVSDSDCCSRNCPAGRCEQASVPAPSCKGLYELCSGAECCSGLSCTSGSCR